MRKDRYPGRADVPMTLSTMSLMGSGVISVIGIAERDTINRTRIDTEYGLSSAKTLRSMPCFPRISRLLDRGEIS